MINGSFQTRLLDALKKNGMSQSELARSAGLSEAVISRMVNEPNGDLRVSSLWNIAYALGCDPVELYFGSTPFERHDNFVYVWDLEEMKKHPFDAIPFIQTKIKRECSLPGPLFGIHVDNDDLLQYGLSNGNVAVIDSRKIQPEKDGVVLVLNKASNQYSLSSFCSVNESPSSFLIFGTAVFFLRETN